MGFALLPAGAIEQGAVTAGAFGANSIAIADIGTMIPGLLGRQGGSSGDWSVVGTSNYTSGLNVRVQAGVRQVTVANGQTAGTATITFPVAFSSKPIMIVSIDTISDNEGVPTIACYAASASAATIDVLMSTAQSGTTTLYISWLAIGPE
jgi:hypothetical protein